MNLSIWRVSSGWLAGMLLFPVAAVAVLAVIEPGMSMASLWAMLPRYGGNTLTIMAESAAISLLLALPFALIMARYRFQGQRWLHLALLLPLAMPAYLLAAVYGELLEFGGPVRQTFYALSFASLSGWGLDWSPPLRQVICSVCLALSLFPYLYLLLRATLMSLPESVMQSGRLHCPSSLRLFFRVRFPLILPTLWLGLAVVALEAVSDYGAASYFSVPTLTTASLDFWRDKAQFGTAARMALVLLPLIVLLGAIARHGRLWQVRYQRPASPYPVERPEAPVWLRRITLSAGCGLVLLAFGVPLFWLARHWLTTKVTVWTLPLLLATINSALAASCATLILLGLAMIYLFDKRTADNPAFRHPLRWLGFNRVLPGSLAGMGVLVALMLIDSRGMPLAMGVLSGSVLMLILVYSLRGASLIIAPVHQQLRQLPAGMNAMSRTLGYSTAQNVWLNVFPSVRGTLLVGALLVWSESLRELNASLLLQRVDVDTLSTYVFGFVESDQLAWAAAPAFLLVLLGVPPLFGLHRLLQREG
ncbi:ABC transporter permease [Lonsdalea quercina]|uniref:ABC transporter permease n=1 Tax=Lonsdalea quercina TaxID=71657 RepID=UPI003976568B